MDSQFEGYYDSVDGYQSLNGTMSVGSEEFLNYDNLFNYNKDPSLDLASDVFPTLQPPDSIPGNFPSFFSSSGASTKDADSPDAIPGNLPSFSSSSGASTEEAGSPDDSDSDATLKFIRQVLMEDDMNEKPCMLHSCLALQAAEKPFYDALGKEYPLSPDHHPLSDHYVYSPEDSIPAGPCGDYITSPSSNTVSTINADTTISVDSTKLSGSSDFKGLSIQNSVADPYVQPSTISTVDFGSLATVHGIHGSDPRVPVGFNIFSDRESMIQFQKGVEEANKFLPKITNFVIDLDNMTYPEEPKEAPPTAVKSEKEGNLPEGLRGRRIHYLDDDDLEDGRNRKQSAISVDEEADELSAMFDRVLLYPKKNEMGCYTCSELPNGEHQKAKQGLQPQELDQGVKGLSKKEDVSKNVVDLRTLLILSAQAVSSDDQRTAAELLKQIRQHSSSFGDGSQRLAHYFANALEARMAGTGTQMYTALASKMTTAAQILKAYHFYVSFCPFKKISYMFSNLNILKVSEKRKKLHIIDIGILYGFQWPALIQCLSERPEGPPLLRITGIELPQPGFRPAGRVEETGRRLAKYCERFGVQFEFNPIAQKWETIKLEDIKLERDEVVVVNSMFRFKNLLDETIVVDSPRDAVLNLIRKIKPHLFVQATVNGSFSAPFFITRFREALFYYSSLFDMFDTKVEKENQERSMYEREIYGREIMNVVACEGTERVERPETYKQWQARSMRSGFRPLPLDPEIMEKARLKMTYYHKDYSLDVDGNWTLMGWKGRVAYAISAWIPS